MLVTSVGTANARRPIAMHFLGRRLQRVRPAARQHDVGAVFGQYECGAATNARPSTGDDGDTAIE